MKKQWIRIGIACLLSCSVYTQVYASGQGESVEVVSFEDSSESEAQAAFLYYLDEVELDATLTHAEQDAKIEEFKAFAKNVAPEAAGRLTSLLLQETRARIIGLLQDAKLDEADTEEHLAEYEKAIEKVQGMNVEIARQMLFFVAELKIHRQYVHDFGVAIGAPSEQFLHHDLCKLSSAQFEGYARYFRGGKLEEDKPAYLAAWAVHQYEEHHYQSYSKEGFDFNRFTEQRIRNNMLEAVADWLASVKQRGGGTLIYYLVHIFPKHNPHPRLLPYLKEGLLKAHTLYLQSEEEGNPDNLFNGLPSWNSEVEQVFNALMG